ncbi:hypothetical protein PTTG_02669 [Puccinia triticina 1-1 BBBD Race 1]|uniref:HIT domain-containing protein n=2 Tax=Puccinia triticina TaxID=208348 RepID=A0A0C4EPG7_PUCT1|nr:uncharacterized protein PtA15_1A157 [Puccinia triticina]OAV91853.1 hypothetical protein PTTG_02669 [Puccinia triticina 1-1 BBBD Race 1]WAQ80819.1 hypothetical protein PtA15_1A157 [Puccinia triticina]WAR51709.1 hypothetical protein PtB15_1B145 [Puccinia triticina]
MLLRTILNARNHLSTGPAIILHGSIRMSSSLKFSSFDVTNQVFFRSDHSFAIVNLKPIAPGHVLVIPKRTEAKRLADLSRDEVADLFGSVQRVGSVMESVHKASSLTVAIQDGPFAGQSVPHLHVHVIPRRPNDFVPNDKIYDHLNRFDGSTASNDQSDKQQVSQLKIDNEERVARTQEDMEEEAKSLSQHFQA